MARRFVAPASAVLAGERAGPLLGVIRSALRFATHQLAPPPRPATGVSERHPLAPAAIRVERSRSRGSGASADQTAVTMWFGDGPALPGPSVASPAVRATMRLGAGVLGAAALAAAGTLVARRSADRLALPARPPALTAPQPAGDGVRPLAAP